MRKFLVYLLWMGGSVLLMPGAAAAQTAAEQEFLFAYRLMQRGDLAEAGAAFDDFLEKFPQDDARGDVLYFRAALYRQAGALTAAAEVLEGVKINGAGGGSMPRRVPAYAVGLLRGQVLTDLGEFDKALTVLEGVDTSRLPAKAEASVSLLRALAYRGAGNFDAAASAAAAAAGSPGVDRSTAVRARLEQGRAEAAAGRIEAARAALDQALVLDSEGEEALEAARLAGDVAYQAGDYDAAAGYYQRVIERGQSSAPFGPAVVGRMWADLRAGRNVSVVNSHKQFAEALPETGGLRREAGYLAASAYQNLGQSALAVELLTAVVEASDVTTGNANNAEGVRNGGGEVRALALYKLAVGQFDLTRYDDLERTVAQLEREFPRSPQQVDASFLLASADAKRGRGAEGLARFKSLIDDGPANPYYGQALRQRAALLEQSGELSAAAADLQQYLENESSEGVEETQLRVRLRLADLRHRLGDYAVAVELSQSVLADPQAGMMPGVEQEAYYRLGEAQTRRGEYRDALDTFETLQTQHPINPYRHAVDLRRGLLLQQLGRTDQAMAVLIEAGNDERLPRPQRAAALRIIAAHLRDSGRPGDAALTLRRIEQLAGLEALRDAELLWLGDYEVQRGEPALALRTLAEIDGQRRVLTPGENSGVKEAELRFTRGRAHFRAGTTRGGVPQFLRGGGAGRRV